MCEVILKRRYLLIHGIVNRRWYILQQVQFVFVHYQRRLSSGTFSLKDKLH